jgi:death-on-curing protein
MPVFLNRTQIVEIHDAYVRRYGGDMGGGHRGESYEGVDAVAQAVKNSYYETLVELAAAYAVYIVQGHVFLDGNKRAAYAAMVLFLGQNGVVLPESMDLAAAMITMQRACEPEDGGRPPATNELVGWLSSKIRVVLGAGHARGRARTVRR